jgi:hypothetical protein
LVIAGEESTAPAVVKFQMDVPETAFKQYTMPSKLPTITRPPATAGEEST